MGAARQVVARSELTILVLGTGLTAVAVMVTTHIGTTAGLGALIVPLLFLAAVTCFLVAPHVAVALTIPIFALIPASKALVTLWFGPLKDALTLAAAVAVVLHLLQREGRRTIARTDKGLLLAVGLLVALYVIDLGGALGGTGHDTAWLQGTRLVTEPLLLLLAGLLLPEPRRTLNWAAPSLVATGCFVALYGIGQQLVGPARLVGYGYSYDQQVKAVGGHLRSFGTLDDSFAYAALLLIALATVLFWMRRGLLALACGALLLVGLAASLVHTAAIITGALVTVWLVRAGRPAAGLVLFAALVGTGIALTFATATATETRSVDAGPGIYVTLNGRTSVWGALFPDKRKIPLGLGVGEVGRAAIRANIGVTDVSGSPGGKKAGQFAVDSGYLSTVADIGLAGLAVLLFLAGRLVVLARRATMIPGDEVGWLALGYLTVLLVDAITRDSFTGFPTAFLGLLLIGITLAVAREESGEPRNVVRPR